jgi:predicted DsbA family dithiol-disulfide isomerase
MFDAVHRRLFDANWVRARDIGDESVLVEEGTAAGLDESEIVGALTDDRYLERIRAETRTAIGLGAGGVPAWLVDDRLLIPGAQPHEVFDRILRKLGHQPHH